MNENMTGELTQRSYEKLFILDFNQLNIFNLLIQL